MVITTKVAYTEGPQQISRYSVLCKIINEFVLISPVYVNANCSKDYERQQGGFLKESCLHKNRYITETL